MIRSNTSIVLLSWWNDAFSSVVNFCKDRPFIAILILLSIIFIKWKLKLIWLIIRFFIVDPIRDIIDWMFRKRRRRSLANLLCISTYLTICICGDKGSGKTTGTAGIINFLERKILSNINSRTFEIKTIMNKEFSFTELDDAIRQRAYEYNRAVREYNLIENKTKTIEEKYKEEFEKYKVYNIVKEFEVYYMDFAKGRYWYNYKHIPYTDLFYEYIEMYYHKCINNYVFSYTDYVSNVTGNRNYEISPDAIQIRNKYHTCDSVLRRDSVINYDDITNLRDFINLNWQNSTDGGSIEFMRLERQLGKERMYFLANAQHHSRINKATRELFDVVLQIVARDRHRYFKTARNIISFIDWCNETAERIRYFFTRVDKDDYQTRYKNIKKWCMEKENYYAAKDELIYYFDVYDDNKAAENESSNCVRKKVYIPVADCYGCVDTFEFAKQLEALQHKSKVLPTLSNKKQTIEEIEAFTDPFLKKIEEDTKPKSKKDKKQKEAGEPAMII